MNRDEFETSLNAALQAVPETRHISAVVWAFEPRWWVEFIVPRSQMLPGGREGFNLEVDPADVAAITPSAAQRSPIGDWVAEGA